MQAHKIISMSYMAFMYLEMKCSKCLLFTFSLKNNFVSLEQNEYVSNEYLS